MPWPSTIPHDLAIALAESQSPESWWWAFRSLAKTHGLRLKLQWMASLARELDELDQRRTLPTNQDRWGVIQEWLERNDVEAPEGLPVAPEMSGGKFVC